MQKALADWTERLVRRPSHFRTWPNVAADWSTMDQSGTTFLGRRLGNALAIPVVVVWAIDPVLPRSI